MSKKVKKNSSAFKHIINVTVVKKISHEINHFYPPFNKKKFLNLCSQLEELELKARVLHITAALKVCLPQNYETSISVIISVMNNKNLKGFELWPFSEYISQFGLEDFPESFAAMHILTQHFTSEFAVRPFFEKDLSLSLKYFSKWLKDPSQHVRRWLSEGSRPLLPWGKRVTHFIKNPTCTQKILDYLKYDDELYVRKSVANHLNDLSKIDPSLTIETIKKWEKNSSKANLQKILWIKKHALRTLIKKGNQQALQLMGVSEQLQIITSKIKLNQNNYKLSDKLEFSFEITSHAKINQTLIIDYVIHFVKSNGQLAAKVFKLKTLKLAPNQKIQIKKTHSLRPITTMQYYRGDQRIQIQINGSIVAQKNWYLQI